MRVSGVDGLNNYDTPALNALEYKCMIETFHSATFMTPSASQSPRYPVMGLANC